MTAYHWHQTRERAIDLFGETPSATLEQTVIEYFAERPAHTADLIERIGAKVQNGKIRSGWGVLRSELTSTPAADITATDEADRDKRIRSAKQWIENAGCHYDLERQVAAELFGDEISTGRLHGLQLTEAQREDLLDHWRQHRPRGQQAEQDHEAWNAECAGNRQRVTEILKRKKREREAAQEGEPCASSEQTPTSSSPPPSSPSHGQPSDSQSGSSAEPLVAATADDDIPW